MDRREIAALLTQAAEEELQSRFTRVVSQHKADGSLITEADMAMQTRVIEELTGRWPDVAVLGEEMGEAEQQAILRGEQAFWCLDPLDGTTNFASGIPYYAVSLALVSGGQVQAGWVLDPQRGECFSARRGEGAWLNDRPLQTRKGPASLDECVALVDFKRLPAGLAQSLAQRPPFRSQRSFGAVALDWCWIAAGRSQIYLHGRQNLWDYAAGSLVLAEAGGSVCVADGPAQDCGGDLRLGSRTGIGAVDADLFETWRTWIREAM